MKPVKFSKHSRLQMSARGASESEVIATLTDNLWLSASWNTQHAVKIFDFNGISPIDNNTYLKKKIDVKFINETEKIIVVTLKVNYYN